MRYELLEFGNDAELARAAAVGWVESVGSGSVRRLALSGGRVAAPFYRECVANSRRERVSWGEVDIFWADERCVGPEDGASNYGVARRQLLGPLGLAPERVHRIRGELEPGEAAAAAEKELRGVGGGVLDLVILGMGEDGHVASLFPPVTDVPGGVGRLYVAVLGPKPPPWRVTLTYGALAAAREVWVLVSGAGKAGALGRALAGDGTLPLGRVLAERSLTRFWVVREGEAR
jgi:6-phosphogluconolactonase